MSCVYCKDEKIMFKREFISSCSWGWGGETRIKESEAYPETYGLFYDRGYLRFVDLDDCNCIEAGEKVRAFYCFNCGDKLAE